MSYKAIFLSILSAILLILSFPKPELGFLAWFALVPWLFAVQRTKPGISFLLSYLVGVLFFCGIVYWVNYVSSLGFAVLVLYLALYFAAFGLLVSINNKLSTISKLLFIPAFWVALEYIRTHLFSGFPWSLLGYSQYLYLPVIQFSDITGAYGISFVLVLVNVGIWQLINRLQITDYRLQKRNPPKKILSSVSCPLSAVLCVLALVLGYGYWRLGYRAQGQALKVAVVQGNIPQVMKWDPRARDYIVDRYTSLSEQAAFCQPDLIVWPETSLPGYLEADSALHKELLGLAQKVAPAALLIGAPHETEKGQVYNSATLIVQRKIIQRYDKVHLVPFGEFMPWPRIFSYFSFAGLIGNFSPGKDYAVFSLPEKPGRFSVLICFEDVFGYLARRFAQRKAQILINMTNDAWFQDSSEAHQHLQASVFRAVENRVNLVRSANTGVSCFINPWGKIVSRVCDEYGRDLLVAGVKIENLELLPLFSFYTAFGDIFAWLCIVASGFTFLGLKGKVSPDYTPHRNLKTPEAAKL